MRQKLLISLFRSTAEYNVYIAQFYKKTTVKLEFIRVYCNFRGFLTLIVFWKLVYIPLTKLENFREDASRLKISFASLMNRSVNNSLPKTSSTYEYCRSYYLFIKFYKSLSTRIRKTVRVYDVLYVIRHGKSDATNVLANNVACVRGEIVAHVRLLDVLTARLH